MHRPVLALLSCLLAFHIGNTETRAQASLKLYVFNCGMFEFESVETFGVGDEETDVRRLAVPCYVIEHERGRLLWNGGLPSGFAAADGWQGEEAMRMRLDRTLPEQLAEMGLGMDAFDYVAFSHLHFDHIGVANEVVGATWLIQRPEYEAAFADAETAQRVGFDPSLYASLREGEVEVLEGEHDVFGDGRVRILPAPGHTPGHQVLFIDLAETGPVVLSGDLYILRLGREERRVPSFNYDAEQTRASMDAVEAFLEAVGAELWIEHELAWFEQLRKAPAYYN